MRVDQVVNQVTSCLAFYFSKENFESANRNVRDLVGKITGDDKLGQMKVTDGMIPYQNFIGTSIDVETLDKLEKTKVDDMIKKLNDFQKQRLPIMIGKKVEYIFHKSMLLEFQYDLKSTKTTTIKDMKTGSQWIVNILNNGVKFLGIEATLLEAKQLMESQAACNDVMVTSNGKSDGEVIGWITDKVISEKSKV